ncbi:4-hydroxyphenylacetate 3-hydroxylase N-terminal domain-containing protein [Streptomyces sp. NPDC051018]|uniref:4-hydroxyphenylacetate 3-hydroxylase N-terminal domain-containing protein n=1 Tax=Streptomyces sp. NPDC051018 TaxID=3365639 RepID=UPI0037925C03
MIRSGRKYLDALRDGREVWLDGERVEDVTGHPAFRNTASSIARLYDLAHDSEHSDLLTADGVHRAYVVPRTHADLVARREAYKVWAEAGFGFLGRTPDCAAGGTAGFAALPRLFTTDTFDGADNVLAYHRGLAEEDLYCAFTTGDPGPGTDTGTGDGDPAVRAVKECDGGIVVRGVKTIGTGAVFADEVIVGTTEPLAPRDADHALCFSLPLDTPGLKLVSRMSYEARSGGVFDDPLSSRFDENDSLLVCEDVFVPWERVLTYRNVEATAAMWWGTPAYLNFVHQAATRFWTRLEFLTGVAILLTRSSGTRELPAVSRSVGRLLGMVAQAKAFVLAAEASWEHVDGGCGGVMPGTEISCAQRGMAGELYPRAVQEVRRLAGGSDRRLPESAEELLYPVPGAGDGPGTPGTRAKDRMKLLKLAREALGSEFAARHERDERFCHGVPYVHPAVRNRPGPAAVRNRAGGAATRTRPGGAAMRNWADGPAAQDWHGAARNWHGDTQDWHGDTQDWHGGAQKCERLATACLDGYDPDGAPTRTRGTFQ